MTPISLELGPARWARIWLDELPNEAEMSPSGIVRSHQVRATAMASTIRQVAFEIRVPAGPHSHYALVGVTFTPASNGAFELDAAWSEHQRSVSFVAGGKTRALRSGLSKEQASDAVRAIDLLDGVLAQGTATITHALVSDVDTSPIALRAATVLACSVIVNPGVIEHDESLSTLTEDIIATTIGSRA